MKGLQYFKYITPDGYLDIYQNLTKYIRKDIDTRIYSLFLMYGLLITVVLILFFPYATYILYEYYPETYYNLTKPNTLLFWFGVFIASIWSFFLLKAAISIRDPYRAVPELKALMVVFITRPFTQINGLRHVDVIRLLEIAEVEQNSADWRGNNINLLVVGTITAMASWLLLIINNSGEEIIAGNLSKVFSNDFEILDFSLVVPMFAFGLLFFSYIIRKLFIYFQEYTLSEASNRIIIIACKELAYYMEDNKLMGENIAFIEKKKTIENFGCQLVEIFDNDYPLDVIFVGENNTRWTLLCFRESLSLPVLFYPWRIIQKTIKWSQEIVIKFRNKGKK